jgi:predicted metal-dependent hydrolase
VERSEIQFGLSRIPYAIQRSSKRGTVAITVDLGGRVLLTAPAGVPVERLDRVVRAKAAWIFEKRRKRRDRPAPLPPRELVSGETFLYLGRQYRLRVERRPQEGAEAGLQRGWLVVPLFAGSESAEQVRSALESWYQIHAARRLPERSGVWAHELGIPAPRVLIREPKKRWGSCDARGTVRFNWRVIQAPMRLVDYVVAHELVHLEHPDHTKAFWATLGRVMPDYEARREALRALGGRLIW